MELVRFEPLTGYNNLRSLFSGLFDENFGRASAQPRFRNGILRWMFWKARIRI